MEISKDGKWAAFCDPDSDDVFLLDGANRRKHELVSGWAYGIKWLPAVDAGNSTHDFLPKIRICRQLYGISF
jgi:hypothetical protein